MATVFWKGKSKQRLAAKEEGAVWQGGMEAVEARGGWARADIQPSSYTLGTIRGRKNTISARVDLDEAARGGGAGGRDKAAVSASALAEWRRARRGSRCGRRVRALGACGADA